MILVYIYSSCLIYIYLVESMCPVNELIEFFLLVLKNLTYCNGYCSFNINNEKGDLVHIY